MNGDVHRLGVGGGGHDLRSLNRDRVLEHLQDLEDIQEAGSQVQRHELAALRYARRVRIIGVRQQDLRPVSGGGEGAQELRVSHGTVEHERAFL